jgi:hypothetical protein
MVGVVALNEMCDTGIQRVHALTQFQHLLSSELRELFVRRRAEEQSRP